MTGTFLAGLAACSPALDWRDVAPEDAAGLRVQFPCKPEQRDRVVPVLADAPAASMHVLSCQAADATWAVSYMVVPDVRQIEAALQALAEGPRHNLQVAAADLAPGSATPVSARIVGAAQVPGMTPQLGAQAWRYTGQRPDGLGRPVQVTVDAWHFSHGLTVFQASVWRSTLHDEGPDDEDVAQTFLRSLHFRTSQSP